MPNFRKKPVVIEAVQLTPETVGDAIAFLSRGCPGWFSDDTGVFIPTLEGTLHVSEGDWIIRGVQGEYYPCKPDIFAATYEPA